ncbi:MAG: hypothetical protein HY904_13265 [Deltaproteobacteria bacterium]|nr:hypothetical protein [Deltaproteobacteria bacterium]
MTDVRRRWAVVVAVAALPAALACTPTTEKECAADDQCAVGLVCRGGRCLRNDTGTDAGSPDAGGAPDAGGSVDAGNTPDAATQHDGGQADAGAACPHDEDNTLTAAELPLALGVPVRFLEAADAGPLAVDLVGTVASGAVQWDFTGAVPGDRPIEVSALALDGLWFKDHYPEATYVVALDGAATLYAVYRRTATELTLLGEASAALDVTRTVHTPPVTVLRFPLVLGVSFSTTTQTTGTLEGNPFYLSNDTYELTVDAAGRVLVPAGSFHTLRVRLVQDVSVPIAVWPFALNYHWVRYSFMTPCYGVVTQVVSQEGEAEVVFTQAAELRRLGLPP